MGRKAGIMRVNPKAFAKRTRPCLSEMLNFLACLKKANFNDDGCMQEKKALQTCMDLQAKSGKSHNTINYHLQRISRMMKGQ
ncbi:hypothetical protein MPTK1_5g13260 [Marchantia polymorpha subsp. ruderalis]|uniref:IMS import disulfide relay-system CHCH-CHCH-like Cx9C domain-containing protein n=2 Tax=Marchantia polymorpha TaxID=3197 RepID=A0A176VR75_MARPO|nr:hypothetical protein AXG93_961s1080 [Marchantia polymorpha subsp. ruderalis]PTQ41815.1 hypothetical protein MARPO_0032s0020 [Marchantia polymorpha]BBN11600.1 hypothetical protein Mp_5g13260 [Marchantia polymorpha subsp. ruderalis]|eukprot:PTQ41815.1 hypothetical protein MARPO_0032s0020 [Marchantia polymorpha]